VNNGFCKVGKKDFSVRTLNVGLLKRHSLTYVQNSVFRSFVGITVYGVSKLIFACLQDDTTVNDHRLVERWLCFSFSVKIDVIQTGTDDI